MSLFFLVVGVNHHKEKKSLASFDYLGEEWVGKLAMQHQVLCWVL